MNDSKSTLLSYSFPFPLDGVGLEMRCQEDTNTFPSPITISHLSLNLDWNRIDS